MGRWVHRLSEVDPSARTAICAECGPVRVVRSGESGHGFRCGRAFQAQRKGRKRNHGRSGHGLTQREAREYKEGKACEICGARDRLVVDHCHKTGVIRGVLCSNCNTAIGMLRDDVERLRAAIEYLSRF